MQIAKYFRSRHAAWVRLAVLSFMGLAAIGVSGPASAQMVLGTGPGIAVTDADMRAAAELIPRSARAGMLARPQNVEQQAQGIFLRRMLTAEAVSKGVDKDPIVIALLAQARERILSDALLADLDLSVTPSDANLQAYAQAAYKAEPQRFQQPAQTHVRHLLVRNNGPQARAKAEALLAKIKAGASFEDVARAESDDIETSASGGDLGFFAAGKMVKPFEDAVADLKAPGDISGIVQTEFGFHLIKLVARRPAGILPYAEVSEPLRNEAKGRARREARTAKINKLLEQFKADPVAIEGFSAKYRK